MNYQKIYYDLVLRAKLYPQKSEYYENHHILPDSLGGTKHKSNMVKFTAKEHYIAHHLLMKWTNTLQMKQAWFFMTNLNGTRIKSREYNKVREELAIEISRRNKGMIPWNKGKTGCYNEKTLKAISESNKGRQTRLGAILTQETKDKIGKKSIDRGKQVNQYNLKGDFIDTFITAKKAGDITGKNTTSIIKCCNGQLSKYSGFIWRYKEDPLEPEGSISGLLF